MYRIKYWVFYFLLQMYHEKVKKPEGSPNILNTSSLKRKQAVKLAQESYSAADLYS